MTVTLELRPEVEANLSARAQARGMSLDAYLQDVIEDLGRAPDAKAASLEEIRAALWLIWEGTYLSGLKTRERFPGTHAADASRATDA